MKKINLITLGCSKNTVDTEHLAAQLAAAGYVPVFDAPTAAARIVVVNTCGFIGDAKQESVDTILRLAAAKQAGRIDRLYVVGCLSERYADALREEIPEVDRYFGARTLQGVVRELGASYRPELCTERLLSTPRHYAYLKIAEGCNRHCGYCAIPLIRGPYVSVPEEQLTCEAQRLAENGVRELIVIAQDTTCYGTDRSGTRRLAPLLEKLCRTPGIEWVRLHYAYPTDVTDELIELFRREPRLCPYLDIPFQHISDRQLQAMRRHHTRAEALELVRRLREALPGLALRTTLLVGYPGESEEDYAQLLDFVRTVRFERLGVFPYSEEEGTWSARHLRDDVPEAEKQRRVEGVMTLQRSISHERNEQRIGERMRVVVDRREGAYYVARSPYDSPEVDGEVWIAAAGGRLRRGCFYEVRVTAADDYDLWAERIPTGN